MRRRTEAAGGVAVAGRHTTVPTEIRKNGKMCMKSARNRRYATQADHNKGNVRNRDEKWSGKRVRGTGRDTNTQVGTKENAGKSTLSFRYASRCCIESE